MWGINMAWRRWLPPLAVVSFALLGCREVDEPPKTKIEPRFEAAREQASEAAPPAANVSAAYLEGALLEGSYDTSTLVQLLGSLPRPSQLGSFDARLPERRLLRRT